VVLHPLQIEFFRNLLEGGQGAMEVQKVSLKDIKIDPLAKDLATSEDAQPYLDYHEGLSQ